MPLLESVVFVDYLWNFIHRSAFHDSLDLTLEWIKLSALCLNQNCFFIQVEEMEIPRAAAERSLREHKGDVVEALVTLTN